MAEAKTEQPATIQPRVFPWQSHALGQLNQAWSAKRFSHALLLQGADGIGKKQLAAWIAAAVLCEKSQGAQLIHCGQCTSCKLIASSSHPDFFWVRPEEDKQQISIDQLRAAAERLTKTSYRQGYKVAVVEPAHQMTPAAANSLLKTLEEPSSSALIILITCRPSSLLPTIRSRCQKLTVAAPTASQALEWVKSETGKDVSEDVLAFVGHAPLKAVQQADGGFEDFHDQMQKALAALLSNRADVTQVAAAWADDQLPDRLTWVDLWLQSLARAALAGTAEFVTFPSRPVPLPSVPRTLNISGVYSLVDRARALKAQLVRTALQRELAVESWLFGLLDLLAPPAASNQRGPVTRSR